MNPLRSVTESEMVLPPAYAELVRQDKSGVMAVELEQWRIFWQLDPWPKQCAVASVRAKVYKRRLMRLIGVPRAHSPYVLRKYGRTLVAIALGLGGSRSKLAKRGLGPLRHLL